MEEETEGVTKRILRPSPALQSLSASVVPMLVQTAVKSIKLKPGGMLPINPATGQLDFMAPVLQKIAAGKKPAFEDFIPVIMEKVMPLLTDVLGGLTGKKPEGGGGTSTTTALPSHLKHASKP